MGRALRKLVPGHCLPAPEECYDGAFTFRGSREKHGRGSDPCGQFLVEKWTLFWPPDLLLKFYNSVFLRLQI